MRGKVHASLVECAGVGITPAYAGKRRQDEETDPGREDHPRVCGEKAMSPVTSWVPQGSPPRMRGKGILSSVATVRTGITPAYAGKRLLETLEKIRNQDHPRVCGEKGGSCRSCAPGRGSPPRMRGKACWIAPKVFSPRITPAYAGKSYHARYMVIIVGDHPRVCGEKFDNPKIVYSEKGSPPRMRGKVYLEVWPHLYVGITPAYAGKRLKRSHSIGHFSCILCLFHSVLHRASVSGGSRAGPCAPPCLPAQNAVPV